MSIINEALKKAGKEQVVQPLELNLIKKKSSFNWGPLFVILVLLLITGPIIAPLFATPFRRVEFQTITPAKVESAATTAPDRKQQFAIEEAPLFQPTVSPFVQPPSLNLTGIVYSPHEAYCIINNKIVKAGETIQEARLIKVDVDQVTLDFKGQRITLTLAR